MIEQKLFQNAEDQLFGFTSYKYRKIIIPLLLLVICSCTVFLIQNHLNMERRIEELSAFEPIYVLSINKDLNLGDIIKKQDLKATLFYKKEFEKISQKDEKSGLNKPLLIPCNYNQKNKDLNGFKNIIGRVVKIPILANTTLRHDHLAPPGTTAGLSNIIPEGYSLLDLNVKQTGFNVFIKPNDIVDLYQVDKLTSTLVAENIKVLLVDSLPLGKAPLQVAVNPQVKRKISLSIPQNLYSKILKIKNAGKLSLTYRGKSSKAKSPSQERSTNFKQNNKRPLFQKLLFIKGKNKEVFWQ